jgi:hypothetical protein
VVSYAASEGRVPPSTAAEPDRLKRFRFEPYVEVMEESRNLSHGRQLRHSESAFVAFTDGWDAYSNDWVVGILDVRGNPRPPTGCRHPASKTRDL